MLPNDDILFITAFDQDAFRDVERDIRHLISLRTCSFDTQAFSIRFSAVTLSLRDISLARDTATRVAMDGCKDTAGGDRFRCQLRIQAHARASPI
jgi:hypothetical protein